MSSEVGSGIYGSLTRGEYYEHATVKWIFSSPQHSLHPHKKKRTFYTVKRTSGTPNHGLLPLDFLLNVQPSATAIYNVFMSERCTNWCFAQYTYYTLFSGHCYFLTFRLCCFGIFQGKYYESSLKLKIFQSSNYTLEVPVHNGHLWLSLQGNLPASPQGGRIQIPPKIHFVCPPPPRCSWDGFGGHITKSNWKQLLTQSVLWGFENSQ